MAMKSNTQAQLLDRWRDILARNREVLSIWTASDFRLRIGGIDITEAEIATGYARVAHLEVMIAALEKSQEEPHMTESPLQPSPGARA